MFREEDAAFTAAGKDYAVIEEDRAGEATSTGGVAQLHLLAVLSALMAFASISTDFYLPAMPAMALALGASEGMLAYTISGYLVGFSFGQLVWGPVSDQYGRRMPVAGGLVLFIIGSTGCALSQSAEAVIVWRIVQALGASASVVLSRAMVRDLYAGSRAAQMMSSLIVVMAVAPLLGPILGAQIATVAGWRAIFWLLVVIGMATLAALFTIPETLPVSRRTSQSPLRAIARYGQLLTRPRLLGYVGVCGFYYAGMYAYIAGSPFAFINYHHVPAHYYGFIFGAGVLGIMATNMINMRIVSRLGIDKTLRGGVLAAAFSTVSLAVISYTDLGGVWGLFIPLIFFVSCTGFIVANSIAGALADFPKEAGAVSALVGALQYGSGIAGSGLVGFLADGTPWPMGLVIGLSGIGCLMSTFLLQRDRTRM